MPALPAEGHTLAGRAHRHGSLPHRRPNRSHRVHAAIVGGTPAERGSFPSLAFVADFGAQSALVCTGTVVAPKLVLTAAHCAEDVATGAVNEPGGYAIVTGNVNWAAPRSEKEVSAVSRIILYPGFVRAGLLEGWGDAALLELATPTSSPAIPLATASEAVLLQAGTTANITGWGDTFFGQERPTEQLQWAPTILQGSDWCQHSAPGFLALGQLCTINPPRYATGTCNGDSGGPLLVARPGTHELVEVGITEAGYGRCSTTKPDVFTRTELISSWVHGVIEGLNPPPAAPLAAPPPPPVSPTAPQPPPAQPASTPPKASPTEPGYYVTRYSKLRKVILHVSGDGTHVVGIRIKMPLTCQHGFSVSVNESWLSYVDNLGISNHIVLGRLEWPAARETKRGSIAIFLRFTSSGQVQGRLRARLPYRSRRIGLCSASLTFSGKAQAARP